MASLFPSTPRSVCVFCGSASGNNGRFVRAASAFGRALAERGITLVYGGGKVGLMGAVADGALKGGGSVVGVMPRGLVEREIAHDGLSELHVVETMHERKTAMSEAADAFAVLPGGAGTLEEAFEQWTWAQLAIHCKPIGFLDMPVSDGSDDRASDDGDGKTVGYFDPLLRMIDGMVASGFLAPIYRDMLIVKRDPGALLEAFARYEPPARKGYERTDAGQDRHGDDRGSDRSAPVAP